MKRWLALLLFVAATAAADGVKPFVSGSAAQIRTAHAGAPTVLALWSLDCPHCGDELALLGEMKRNHPSVRVVLVSTDVPEAAPLIQARLAQHGLAGAEHWVFADDFSERLRFEIDPRWAGELPRSYLIARDGRTEAVSGRLSRERLMRWIAQQNGTR
jgi:hypothetical protein